MDSVCHSTHRPFLSSIHRTMVHICHLLFFSLSSNRSTHPFKRVPSLSFLTKMELNWNDAKKVLPVSLIYISMIATNNICLQYVEVTFYQIARSLTILFTILFSFIFLKVKTSVSVMLACLIVFVGFLLGIKGEVHFSLIGLSFGIISSIFVSLYSVAVKKALSQLDFWWADPSSLSRDKQSEGLTLISPSLFPSLSSSPPLSPERKLGKLSPTTQSCLYF